MMRCAQLHLVGWNYVFLRRGCKKERINNLLLDTAILPALNYILFEENRFLGKQA